MLRCTFTGFKHHTCLSVIGRFANLHRCKTGMLIPLLPLILDCPLHFRPPQATFHQKAAKSQAALRHKHKRNASDPPNNDSVKSTNGSSNSSSSSRRGSTTNSASSSSGLHSINGSSNRSISSSSSTESSAASISRGTGSSTGARNINESSSGDVAGSIANSAVSKNFGGASLPFGISRRGNFLTLAEVEQLQQPFHQHNIPLTSHGSSYDPSSYTEMTATLHHSSSSSHKMQGNSNGASGGGAAARWAPASPPGLESQMMTGSQFNGFYGLPQHLVTALLASSNYSGNGHVSSGAGGPAADAHANGGNYHHSAFPSGSNSVLPTWPHGNIDYRSGGFGASTRVNDPTTGVAATGVRTGASVGTRPLHSATQTMPPTD